MAISNNKPALVTDIVTICYELAVVKSKVDYAYDRYFKTGISSDVNALGAGETVAGTPIDKDTLLSAITLLEQFRNLVGNAAVTQGDYLATILKVAALKGL